MQSGSDGAEAEEAEAAPADAEAEAEAALIAPMGVDGTAEGELEERSIYTRTHTM